MSAVLVIFNFFEACTILFKERNRDEMHYSALKVSTLVKFGLGFRRRVKDYYRRRKVKNQLGLNIKNPFYYPPTTFEGKRTYSIVSAVYRVESYLNQMLSSLLRQSLDFRKHIQVILVDDGSDDGSSEICQEWTRRFPDNIIYIRKENEGQGAARNIGLPYATGDWVGFIDPDDLVDKDYFLSVDRALNSQVNEDELQLVSCNLIMFRENKYKLVDNHPLRYRFQYGQRKVIFDDSCDDIQTSTNSVFINRHHLVDTGIVFKNIRPTTEDIHFIARYLLSFDVPKVLFLPGAKYWYRKRAVKTSSIDTKWSHPGAYNDVLECTFLDLLNRRINNGSKPPRWLQRTTLYHVSWHVKRLLNNHRNTAWIPDELQSSYLDKLHAILRQIDARLILSFELASVTDAHRLAMLVLGDPDAEHITAVEPAAFDANNEQLCLRYFFSGPQPRLTVKLDSSTVSADAQKTRIHRFLGRTLVREYIGWFPWRGNGVLRVFVNGKNCEQLAQKFAKQSVIDSLAECIQQPAKLPLTVKANRILSQIWFYKERFKGAWILMDRDTQADDNAEHLYRYIKTKQPETNVWFVLRKSSHDWDRLKSDGFRLLPFGSTVHKIALLNASHLVSSHADRYVTNYLPRRYYHDLMCWDYTSLRHGVIHTDLSEWLNKKTIRHFITSAQREYASVCGDSTGYKFTEREVALTGLPRHDRLIDRRNMALKPKRIVIMPTWRQSLVGKAIGATNERAKNPGFRTTPFFKAWIDFLASQELVDIARQNNYQLIFFPHANLQPYIEDFVNDNVTVIGHADLRSIQDLLLNASVLITDYSSVAFEMAYLERPVLYYQFDEKVMFGGGHITQRGYFDYRSDGFGPVCTDQRALLQALESILLNGCCAIEPYSQRMRNFFAFRDGRCCERVFNLIESG